MSPGTEGVLDCVEVEGEETGVVMHLYLDDLAAEEAWHGEERHVRGRGQDDRRARAREVRGARAREVRDGDLKRFDHIRDVMDQRGIDVPAVAAQPELRTGRGKLL